MSVVPAGWTEVNGIPLGTLANVHDTLSYDMCLPQTPGCGETRAILVAPPLACGGRNLGAWSCPGSWVGKYHISSHSGDPHLVLTLRGADSLGRGGCRYVMQPLLSQERLEWRSNGDSCSP